jgi:hypothetical protein
MDLSNIAKKYNIQTISSYEYYYPEKTSLHPEWRILNDFPLHAKRDKDLGFIGNAVNLFDRARNKVKKILLKIFR